MDLLTEKVKQALAKKAAEIEQLNGELAKRDVKVQALQKLLDEERKRS